MKGFLHALCAAGVLLLAVGVSEANAETCFGEKARVLKSNGSKKVKFGQAVVLKNRKRVEVKAAGANLICAEGAAVDLRLGGGGSSKVRLGPGDDKVLLVGKIKKTERRTIWAGLGNDSVNVTGRGHTVTYLSPKRVKPGAQDTDTYSGNEDIDTVYDYGGGTDESPNVINGNRALDRLRSGGTARSDLHGGDGTDFLYAASQGDGRDRLFGDRGNDRLDLRSGGKNSNGAYMDGAEGDDWFYGSPGPDTILSLSGVKKIWARGGDDTIIRSATGASRIYGGSGRDTLSYMGQTPPGWRPKSSGVFVELFGKGNAVAGDKGEDKRIESIEHLIGSAFDDRLYGRPGKPGQFTISAGPGNDQISGYLGNVGDGGQGRNGCAIPTEMLEFWMNCDLNESQQQQPDEMVLTLDTDGVPVVLGSEGNDSIDFSYDDLAEAFVVKTTTQVRMWGSCEALSETNSYSCPVDPDLLSIAMISGGGGDDRISLSGIPEHMNMIVEGGPGVDSLEGDDSREITFHVERGHLGKGNDQIWMTDDSTLDAGPGSDTVHMTVMCVGGFVKGGPGIRDGIVFAGLKRGVWASMAAHRARYLDGPCRKPFRFDDDWEGLEGTRESDILIGSKTKGITFLGRDGVDVFKAKNGKYDKITVGGEGRRNTVIADTKDRVLWGWGYAAF